MNDFTSLYKNHRPALHYSVKKGWLNDPNGLLYHGGYYHLYYQFYPDNIKHGPMHWGHARSQDLLHWEDMPVALYPDEKGVIFSGSLVDDAENTSGFGWDGKTPLVAVFTHHKEQDGNVIQSQSLAYSLDGGTTFEKYAGNPVLNLNLKDFRDPKVFWHAESGKWIMPLVAGRKVMLFGSPNLKSWTHLSTFTTENPAPNGIWECPDLSLIPTMESGSRWVLMVSTITDDGSYFGMQYFVGDFDGTTFTPETPDSELLMLDFGLDNYAAVTFNGVEGRSVAIGWMNCWYYGQEIPATVFRGAMTLPRELYVHNTPAGPRLVQKPVRELLENLLDTHICESAEAALPDGPAYLRLSLENGPAHITLSNRDAHLEIAIDPEKKEISIERSGCGHAELGERFLAARTGRWTGTCSTVDLFLDVTSLELFAANGEAVATMQYFTDKPLDTIRVNGISNIEISEVK